MTGPIHTDEKRGSGSTHLKSDILYRLLVDTMNDALVVADADSVITYANQRFCEILGYTMGEVLGSNLRKFIDEDNWLTVEEETKRRRKGESSAYEIEWIHWTGERVPTIVSASPLMDDKGTFVGSFAVVTDITEIRKTATELRQSREMLRLVIDSIPESVFWKDQTLTYVGCNTNFAMLACVGKPEDIVGRRDSDLGWPDNQREQFTEADRSVMKCDEPTYRIAQTLLTPDDRELTVEISRVPLHDAKGNVIGILGTIHDITQRRAKEEEVRRSEQKYRALAEHSMQGISILTSRGFGYVNRAFAQIVDRSVDQLLSMTIDEAWSLVHPDDRPMMRERIDARVARRPLSPSYQYRLLRPDGEVRWVESFATPIEYGGEIAVQTVLVDITDRRQVEREVRAANERASLYLDLMSHDIRNQMQVILSSAALLREAEDDEMRASFYEIISSSVQRCSRMIEEVRSTERLAMAPLGERSLHRSLKLCVDALSSRSHSAVFQTNLQTDEALILADDFLELMLTNILMNAVEHNPKETKHVWVSLVEHGDSYVVTVSDDGPGIPDANKAGLFDQARRFGGLGLHQATQIVEKYGGTLEVYDRVPGDYRQGAEFRITIPRHHRPA
ncbi:MAG: PAS domain S-box protein [Candidatus Thorarchaeota archaeon]|nr:PAS domain S-box protein [Candidatus Thorarchaeota archaeon]